MNTTLTLRHPLTGQADEEQAEAAIGLAGSEDLSM